MLQDRVRHGPDDLYLLAAEVDDRPGGFDVGTGHDENLIAIGCRIDGILDFPEIEEGSVIVDDPGRGEQQIGHGTHEQSREQR